MFFETNDKPVTTSTISWETLKAYLRGRISAFQATKRKQSREEQLKLEDLIHKLDTENAQSPSKDKANKITFKIQACIGCLNICLLMENRLKH